MWQGFGVVDLEGALPRGRCGHLAECPKLWSWWAGSWPSVGLLCVLGCCPSALGVLFFAKGAGQRGLCLGDLGWLSNESLLGMACGMAKSSAGPGTNWSPN